jgi:CRISPR-associated protein (TIGR02584 family)
MPERFDPAEEHPRRVLLAVTGLSPQIVTETLYALAVERRPPWVPTEIRIITTRKGAQNARLELLSDDPGWFRRLCEDYRLPAISFKPGHIHVITGPGGEPLDDILTDADNVAVADFITEHVRAITADPAASLHVSIAGGRKTMGFYVGYALSLFGRSQDQLSHVLVPPPFESLHEFFYPAPRTRVIHDRSGRTLDAKDAEVRLGEIPFVRLREGLPKGLLEGRATFSAAVTEAQKALPPLALHLDPATRTVTAAGKAVVLEPLQFAFYWMMAERCRAARGAVRRDDDRIGKELLQYYARLRNPNSGVYEKSEKAYRDFNEQNFDQTKTKLNGALRRALDDRWASPYLILKLDPIAGSRLHRFGLSLPPEAITIADGPASLLAEHGRLKKAKMESSQAAAPPRTPR